MAAFDTNVIVRILVGDDPVQTPKAEKAFLTHAAANGVYVSLVVLAEIGWVLATAYGWDRATIHTRVEQLVRTHGVEVEDLELVEDALHAYARGRADLSDYLVLGRARADGGGRLLTFDRKLAREPGVSLL